MNKQEMIDKYEYMNSNLETWVDTSKVLKDLKQLDEPQKVTVPQFVADWYEERKDDLDTALFRCVDIIPRVYEDGELNQFQEWFISGETKSFQTLVNMHQFGYEVEKEKRYIVKVKGILAGNNFLNYHIPEKIWSFSTKTESTLYKTKHTRKELEEAGFGWVFDCEGIEIEEVE